MAIGGPDGSIYLWNIANGKRIAKLGGDGTRTDSIAFLPNGKSLVSFDHEQGIRIWDSQTGSLKATSTLPGGASASTGETAWATWTPDNFYTGSDGVEAYLRWRVNGQIVAGDTYQASRRRPDRVEQSLSGRIQPGLADQIRRDAANWQAQPTIMPPVTGADLTAAQPPPVAPDAPDAMLRRALSTGSTFEDQDKTADVVSRIKQALDQGADPNVQGDWGTSALMFLSEAGDLDAVKSLIRRGAKLDLTDTYGATALLHSVRRQRTAVMQALLDAGADIKDRNGHSLLPLKGRPDALGTALIAALDQPSPFDAQATAATNNSFDVEGTALLLLLLGALPNVHSKDGRTPIQFAQATELVEALLAHGAKIDTRDKNGMPPVVQWAMSGQTDLVKIALDHGADVNSAETQGFNCLMFAAQNGHDEVARLLLSRHADPNLTSKDHRTALMLAIGESHLDIAKQILEHGANLELRDDYSGWTALTYAVSREDAEMTRILLDKGANVHTRTKEGESLLKVLYKLDKDDRYGIRAMLKQHGEKD